MAKILLVEDDNNLREIYEARLQAEGYEIVSARDGEEALTVAMKERPDLIISDVMMPKISGFDMLDIIRSTEETKNSKVIMMTALSQAEDKERATKLGADRYLVKSQVTLEDVAKVAREVLEGEHVATPTAEPPKATVDPEESMSPQPSPPAPATENANPVPAPATNDEPVAATDTSDSGTPAVNPTPKAADEPAAPTVDPAQAVASSNTTTSSPNPAPAVAPSTDSTDNTTPVTNPVQPAPSDSEEEAGSVESLGQSVTQEQDAIAAQIENFIDAKKTGSENPETPKQQPEISEELKTEPAPAEEAQEEQSPPQSQSTSETPKKKVIQPLNDITASKSNDLENLLKKEEEKDQMAQIAKEISSKTPGETVETEATDELKAEEALREAKHKLETEAIEHPSENATQTNTSQVSITEDGKLQNSNSQQPEIESVEKPTETPAPATQTTTPSEPPAQPSQPVDNPEPAPAVTQTEPTPQTEPPAPVVAPEPAASVEATPETNPADTVQAPVSTPQEQATPQTPQPEVPAPAPQPNTQSNIPHTNGTSIDGVSQPAKPQQSATNQPNTSNSGGLDPNAISL